jgi:hypothetical protein
LRINKTLHLVVPIYSEESRPVLDAKGKPKMEKGQPVIEYPVVAYTHSTPLSKETVEKYCVQLGQVFNTVMTGGLGFAAGPAMAMRIMKNSAKSMNIWDGDDGVEKGVIQEMRRLTSVIVPKKEGGWQPVPLQVAVDQKHLSEDDQEEAENQILFFICGYASLQRHMRKDILESAAGICGGHLSSLNSTEYAASLKTSTMPVSSGEKSRAPVVTATERKPSASANAVVDGKPASVPV